MGYRTLRQCLDDLEAAGHLVRVADEVDAHLEAAEIHRRVFKNGGPAVLFENVKDCSFPMVSNLFGSIDRARYMFRDTLDSVRRLIDVKIDPGQILRHPLRGFGIAKSALRMRPRKTRRGPVLAHSTSIDQLPRQQSWPDDGGAFITLGQVYSENIETPGWRKSNLGMYRVQLSGGQYKTNDEVGLHYQIHRGIGVHHSAAIRQGKPFRVNVFVGGSPAMTLAAVHPHAMDSWAQAARQLRDARMMSDKDTVCLQLFEAFGRLIANTDRHNYNIVLFPKLSGQGEATAIESKKYSLAPAFDQLPMLYAPTGDGQIRERDFTMPAPTADTWDVWEDAKDLAISFWERCAANKLITDAMRDIANTNRLIIASGQSS